MSHFEILRKYLEKGRIDRPERILSILSEKIASHLASHKAFQSISTVHQKNHEQLHSTQLNVYKGQNKTAIEISKYFHAHSHPSISSVLVHGSIASDDDIAYSDFDGILIIDHKSIATREVLVALRNIIAETSQLFLKQDALQHHGWQILFQHEFSNYPDHLFPYEIIKSSSVLYPSKEINIDILFKSDQLNYSKSLLEITTSILKKSKDKSPQQDLFTLKTYLSQIMLLPALFLQAVNKSPVSKKDSFSLLAKTHPEINQDVINNVSNWRQHWQQPPINNKIRLFHRLRNAGIYNSILAPSIPSNLKQQLTPEFYGEVITICNVLLKKANLNKQGQ